MGAGCAARAACTLAAFAASCWPRLSVGQPAGDAAATEPYVDRVMDVAPAEPEAAEPAPAYDTAGMPRALRAEFRGQASRNEAGRQSSGWARLVGMVDTMNFGAISLDTSSPLWQRESQPASGGGQTFSLHQIDMPIGGHWYASQAAGVIQTPSPLLLRQQASFLVPTRLVQGLSTEWRNDANGISLQAGGGDAGYFSFIGQGKFYGLGNRVAAAGVQVQGAPGANGQALLPPGWTYAALASRSSGAAPVEVPGVGARVAEPAGAGVMQALKFDAGDLSIQGSWLAVRGDTAAASAAAPAWRQGVWLDGAWQSGLVTHRWGLLRLEPELNWQGSLLGGNEHGGYYRWSMAGLRSQWDVQLASLQRVDAEAGPWSLQQAGASVRHYVDQQLNLGATALYSRSTTSALQLSAYAEWRPAWADLRWQSGVELQDGSGLTAWRVSGDQSWRMPQGQRLISSLSWGASRTAGSAGGTDGPYARALEAALSGGVDMSDRFGADLSARTVIPLSAGAARVYNLSASAQWRWGRGWTLGAVLVGSRSSAFVAPAGGDFIPPLPSAFNTVAFPATASRDLWITLRYDFQAGTAAMPLGKGARIGGGGADVQGLVYLDDNDNGQRDAFEAVAANVTVILDGRYTTRTDAQGRFEFPFVASGSHTVVVAVDTLPLPWTVSAEPLTIEVAPRTPTRVELGATRSRVGKDGG